MASWWWIWIDMACHSELHMYQLGQANLLVASITMVGMDIIQVCVARH